MRGGWLFPRRCTGKLLLPETMRTFGAHEARVYLVHTSGELSGSAGTGGADSEHLPGGGGSGGGDQEEHHTGAPAAHGDCGYCRGGRRRKAHDDRRRLRQAGGRRQAHLGEVDVHRIQSDLSCNRGCRQSRRYYYPREDIDAAASRGLPPTAVLQASATEGDRGDTQDDYVCCRHVDCGGDGFNILRLLLVEHGCV